MNDCFWYLWRCFLKNWANAWFPSGSAKLCLHYNLKTLAESLKCLIPGTEVFAKQCKCQIWSLTSFLGPLIQTATSGQPGCALVQETETSLRWHQNGTCLWHRLFKFIHFFASVCVCIYVCVCVHICFFLPLEENMSDNKYVTICCFLSTE